MIADSGLPIPHIRREKGPAGRAKRVIEPQRFRHIRQPVARNGPVGNVIVNLFRAHVVNILRVVDPSLGLAGTNELVRLENDVADAALAHPGVFAAGSVDAVHHHARHRLHAVFPLPARFTLDQTCQQFPVGICHRSFLPKQSPVPAGSSKYTSSRERLPVIQDRRNHLRPVSSYAKGPPPVSSGGGPSEPGCNYCALPRCSAMAWRNISSVSWMERSRAYCLACSA